MLTMRLNSYRLYNLVQLSLRVCCLWKGIYLYQVNRITSCLFITALLLITEVGVAQPQVPVQRLVEQQFEPLFSEISVQLSKDKQRYLNDPMAYQEFIDRLACGRSGICLVHGAGRWSGGSILRCNDRATAGRSGRGGEGYAGCATPLRA